MTVIFIVGPTAIGKTRLAVRLARRIDGEIISADSMQVYKSMRILSQAPRASERKAARHHLIGFFSPQEEYSAAAFRDRAGRIIDSIMRREKIPIVAGGSGLYVKALIDGLFPAHPADLKFRKSMERFISGHGSKRLHEKLSKIDPQAAGTIHPNDSRRIIRALEIHHSTGRTMTELKCGTRGLKDRYEVKVFGLTRPREEIYEGIERRIDGMFDENVVGEVRRLRKRRLSKTAKAVLGYKEIAGYLDSEYDIETAIALMKTHTRRFAKRQLAWFRADERIRWFDVSKMSENEIIKAVIKEYKGKKG